VCVGCRRVFVFAPCAACRHTHTDTHHAHTRTHTHTRHIPHTPHTHARTTHTLHTRPTHTPHTRHAHTTHTPHTHTPHTHTAHTHTHTPHTTLLVLLSRVCVFSLRANQCALFLPRPHSETLQIRIMCHGCVCVCVSLCLQPFVADNSSMKRLQNVVTVIHLLEVCVFLLCVCVCIVCVPVCVCECVCVYMICVCAGFGGDDMPSNAIISQQVAGYSVY